MIGKGEASFTVENQGLGRSQREAETGLHIIGSGEARRSSNSVAVMDIEIARTM